MVAPDETVLRNTGLGATTEALPLTPSLGPALEDADVRAHSTAVSPRVLALTGATTILAVAMAFVAQGLTRLIGLITNLAYFGRVSTSLAARGDAHPGFVGVFIPVAGGVVVGLMARYGSRAIRGHGIPEAMEQVLLNESRIPRRMTFLKPLSAAVAIGTGGPFGAEGPIIATGGALGSWLGQVIHTTSDERKTLLAAGAAAGMAATFGSPLSALLLAIELLLFEYRPRSLIPVAWAAAVATAVRMALVGAEPVFAIPDLAMPAPAALLAYAAIGAVAGLASVVITKAVYAIEDGFERLPIHWMWWPALGGLVVGICGWISPRTLGVGYDNIDATLRGVWSARAVLVLCAWKFVSWAISLGSGTSGGTLAPLLTLGGGLGFALGTGVSALAPSLGCDPRMAALVGMAALFAGASRAVLASLVFAFETTEQPAALLPLLAGAGIAYLVSCLRMRHSIMTEKLARRGLPVVGEYVVDSLSHVTAGARATREVVTLQASETVEAAKAWLASGVRGTEHPAFPVVDARGELLGMVSARDLVAAASDALVADLARDVLRVPEDMSLREVVAEMARHSVGRVPLVDRKAGRRLVGILSRSDILPAIVT
jgi:H+/Cl- antiporter ClcA